MQDEILNVNQVAARLDLHPKTIRNFIRSGQLPAHKVGRQWRITHQDLQIFMGQAQSDPVATGQPQPIPLQAVIPGKTAGSREKIQVSAVVDISVADNEEALRFSNSILAVLNCKDQAYGKVRCDYLYYAKEKQARFILWGGARFIGELLELLSRISE